MPQTEPPSGLAKVLTDRLVEYPEELRFLVKPECNPDRNDDGALRQGNMRVVDGLDKMGGASRCRRTVGYIVYSWPAQAVVLLAVGLDLATLIFTLAVPAGYVAEEEARWYGPIIWAILAVLGTEVAARWFCEGCKFLRTKLGVMELLLVPLSMLEVFLLTNIRSVPLPLLRGLRPLFRGLRLLRVLLRGAGHGQNYLVHLRRVVSGDRIRFMQDGFDLDLAYTTSQVIAMSVPGIGYEAMFCNPYLEVARFLNERHFNKYLVVNTTEAQSYPAAPFFNRILRFPIQKDGVPTLDGLLRLCQVLDCFLRADEKNVVAVHSKHGQGRASVVVLGLLLYRGTYQSANAAIAAFENLRVEKEHRGVVSVQTFDSASQKRFLEYFAKLVQVQRLDRGVARKARLTRIQLSGVPNTSTLDVVGFKHRGIRPGRDGRLRLKRGAPDAGKAQAASPASASSASASEPAPPQGGAGGGGGGNGAAVGRIWTGGSDMEDDHSFPDVEDPRLPEEEWDSQEEDEEEEEEAAAARGCGYEQALVLRHMRNLMEEGAFDSHGAGTRPMAYKPIFSTRHETKESLYTTALTHKQDEDPMAPGVWQCRDLEVAGEIRFEVHRRRTESKARSRMPSRNAWRFWTWCRRRRRKGQLKEVKFKGGMLFSLWLHTGFLEFDEPAELASKTRRQRSSRTDRGSTVTVVLERFAVDKASRAPPLRSYSTTFRLQLDFEVDQRIDWNIESEVETEHPQMGGVDRSDLFDAGWLTWVSEKVWPSFTSGLEMLIRDNVVPSLRDVLPGPLKNCTLAQCSFGDSYPEFEKICACSRSSEGLEVELDISVDYAAKTQIILEAGIVTFGISEVKVKGIVSLKFKPILPQLPVFSALQILFLNPPEIELRFANSLEIANFSLVRNIIHGAIDRNLYELMVLPNVMNISWGDPSEDRTVSFQSVLPHAVVRISVVEARNLEGASSFLRRAPDTQAKLVLGSQSARTSSISKSYHPVWQEQFDFLVYDARQRFAISVVDNDFFTGRSRILGKSGDVEVGHLIQAGQEGKWVPLEGPAELLLTATAYDLAADNKRLEAAAASTAIIASSAPPAVSSTGSISGRRLSRLWVQASPSQKSPPAMFDDTESCVPFGGEDAVGESFSRAESPFLCGAVQLEEAKAGAVALLVCEIYGGRAPAELVAAASLEVRLSAGRKSTTESASKIRTFSTGTITEKAERSILRLQAHGMDAGQIAEALGEDALSVARVMRSHAWNFEVRPKMCLLLHPEDLVSTMAIDLTILHKGKRAALGRLPIERVLKSPAARHGQVMECPTGKEGESIALDVQLRLFALVAQQSPAPPPTPAPQPAPLPQQPAVRLAPQTLPVRPAPPQPAGVDIAPPRPPSGPSSLSTRTLRWAGGGGGRRSSASAAPVDGPKVVLDI